MPEARALVVPRFEQHGLDAQMWKPQPDPPIHAPETAGNHQGTTKSMKIHDNSVPITLNHNDAGAVLRDGGMVELYLTHQAGGGQASETIAVMFTLLDKTNRDLLDELKKRFDEHMAEFAKAREGGH